ncbi:MAG: hypothetical protein U9Q81_22755 [Pseudomonadota bacterium]|nr:hypothetical protein [Pseudomonadota bacterium]
MNIRLIRTSVFLTALVVVSALVSGMAFAQAAAATPGPGMGTGMQQPGGPGGGIPGLRQGKGKQGAGKHGGRHGEHGKGQGGKHLFGEIWNKTLTDEQKAQLDQLHVNYAKIKAPLKSRVKALQVDLAVLSTAAEPDKAVIDAKIAELLNLEGEMMGAEYGYIAAQRRVLTPEQQVSFDMATIHKAMHGKEGKEGHRGKH